MQTFGLFLFILFIFFVKQSLAKYPLHSEGELLEKFLVGLGALPAVNSFLTEYTCVEGKVVGFENHLGCDLQFSGRITEILYRGAGLTGRCVFEVLGLLNLRVLDVSDNQLNGPLFDGIASSADRDLRILTGGNLFLQELNVSFNQLTGVIPDALAPSVRLARLDFRGNLFVRRIPYSIQAYMGSFGNALEACALFEGSEPVECPETMPTLCRPANCISRRPAVLVMSELMLGSRISVLDIDYAYVEVLNPSKTESVELSSGYSFSRSIDPTAPRELYTLERQLSSTSLFGIFTPIYPYFFLPPGRRIVICTNANTLTNLGNAYCDTEANSNSAARTVLSFPTTIGLRNPDGVLVSTAQPAARGKSFHSLSLTNLVPFPGPLDYCVSNERVASPASSVSFFGSPGWIHNPGTCTPLSEFVSNVSLGTSLVRTKVPDAPTGAAFVDGDAPRSNSSLVLPLALGGAGCCGLLLVVGTVGTLLVMRKRRRGRRRSASGTGVRALPAGLDVPPDKRYAGQAGGHRRQSRSGSHAGRSGSRRPSQAPGVASFPTVPGAGNAGAGYRQGASYGVGVGENKTAASYKAGASYTTASSGSSPSYEMGTLGFSSGHSVAPIVGTYTG